MSINAYFNIVVFRLSTVFFFFHVVYAHAFLTPALFICHTHNCARQASGNKPVSANQVVLGGTGLAVKIKPGDLFNGRTARF